MSSAFNQYMQHRLRQEELRAAQTGGGSYETGSDGAAGGTGARRVLMGPQRARGDAAGSRVGPYISRAPIRDSLVILRGSSGPMV